MQILDTWFIASQGVHKKEAEPGVQMGLDSKPSNVGCRILSINLTAGSQHVPVATTFFFFKLENKNLIADEKEF